MPRVLSTTELGAIRYAQALSDDRWPVEFRHRDGVEGASFGATSDVPKLVANSAPSGEKVTAEFNRAGRGEWRALAHLPSGDCTYALNRGGQSLDSGVFTVTPPEASLRTSGRASALAARAPSGATQRDEPAEDGRWLVDFSYSENNVGVQDVFLDLVEEDKSLKCTRQYDDNGRDLHTVTASVKPGECRYRFRVVFREQTSSEAAPLTRLGYDPSCSSQRNGLSTWELSILVNDLGRRGATAGETLMKLAKSDRAEISQAAAAADDAKKENVEASKAEAAIDNAKQDKSESSNAEASDARKDNEESSGADAAVDDVAVGKLSSEKVAAFSQDLEPSSAAVERAGETQEVPVTKQGLPAGLLALSTLGIALLLLLGRGAKREDNEDIVFTDRQYLEYARSQGL